MVEFYLGDDEGRSGDGGWRRLHSNVNVPNAT